MYNNTLDMTAFHCMCGGHFVMSFRLHHLFVRHIFFRARVTEKMVTKRWSIHLLRHVLGMTSLTLLLDCMSMCSSVKSESFK